MPAPFQPVVVPFTDGVRGDLSDLAGQPSALTFAENVTFTKRGSVRPRAGVRRHSAEVVTLWDTTGTARTTTLASPGYNVSGPVRRASGSSEEVLLACHGRLLRRASGAFQDAGPLWSLKRSNRAAAVTIDQSAVTIGGQHSSVGRNVVGVPELLPSLVVGFPAYVQGQYDILGPTPIGSAITGNAQVAVASTATVDAVFINDGANKLWVRSVPVGGISATDTQLAADCALTVGDGQVLWAVTDGTDGFVAYATTTAAQVKVLRVTLNANGTAAVAGTVTYALTNAITSVGVSVGNGKGVLIATNSVNTTVRTRVFTTSTMVDAALNVDLASTGGAGLALGAVAGVVQDKAGTYTAWCAWYDKTGGGLDLASRSTTAATGSVYRTLVGQASGLTPDVPVQWRTLFPAQSVQNRPLMGVTVDPGAANRGTWLVLDVGLGTVDSFVSVAAAGSTEGCVRAGAPGTAAVDTDGSLLFGVREGVSFDINGCAIVAAQPVRLTPTPPPVTHANALTLLGGCQSYYYDGTRCFEAGFPGSAPAVGVVAAAGVGAAAGSYTFQTIWTFTDASGNVHRSVASLPATITTVAATQFMTWTATVPQTTSKGYFTTLEVYMTDTNPSAGAPLYLMIRSTITPGVAVMTGTVVTGPNKAKPQLYIGGNVVNDERPPGGDRGVAYVQDRVWVASENNVYASKVIRPGIAPAWYTGGFLTVRVPSYLGVVTTIAALDDKLVVIGSLGTGVLSGPGYDDLGNGPGFSPLQLVHPEGNAAGARAGCTTPQGVAWASPDGLVRVLSRGLEAQVASRPAPQVGSSTADVDVVLLVPGAAGQDASTDTCLVVGDSAGNVRVLDLETGQWANWPSVVLTQRLASVQGVLWATVPGAQVLVDFSTADGADDGTPFEMGVQTRPFRLGEGGAATTWGRVRMSRILGQYLGDCSVIVAHLHDDTLAQGTNKTIAVTAADFTPGTNWPWSASHEVFSSVQRAASVSVLLRAMPALAQWDQLELWVSGTRETAPARNRS